MMLMVVITKMMMLTIDGDATFVRSNILSWRSPTIDCREQQCTAVKLRRPHTLHILVSLSLWERAHLHHRPLAGGSHIKPGGPKLVL